MLPVLSSLDNEQASKWNHADLALPSRLEFMPTQFGMSSYQRIVGGALACVFVS